MPECQRAASSSRSDEIGERRLRVPGAMVAGRAANVGVPVTQNHLYRPAINGIRQDSDCSAVPDSMRDVT